MEKPKVDFERRLAALEGQVQTILSRLDQDQDTGSTDQDAQSEAESPSLELPISTYARVLKSFANPLRITILKNLDEAGKYNSEIGEITGLSSAQLNFHLSTLISSGLIAREATRGRYLITDLGREALRLTSQLANSLQKYETVELDRYCPYCGKAKMKIDVYPTYFQGWCPECSPDGSKWTETGVNPYGQEWKNKNLDEFVDEGWKLCEELVDEAMKDSRCGSCSAKMEFREEEDAIRGRCYSCGATNCKTIKYVTRDVMSPLWRRYKKISQKVEGPLDCNGHKCWKATITTPQGHTITQYRKTHTGEIINQTEQKPKTKRTKPKTKKTSPSRKDKEKPSNKE